MRIKKSILLVGDIIILYISLAFTLAIRYDGFNFNTFRVHLLPFSIIYFIWLIVFYIHNLYELDIAKNNLEFFSSLIRALIINGLIGIAFFYLVPGSVFGSIAPKTNLFLNILVFVVLFCAWRYLFNFIAGSLRIKTNIAILGYNPQAIELAKEILKNPQKGYNLKIIIKDGGPNEIPGLEKVKIMPGLKNLKDILLKEKIKIAIVTPDIYRSVDSIESLFECIPYKINIISLTSFYEKFVKKIPVSTINRLWFLENISQNPKSQYEWFKKYFDFISALALLIVASPLWLIIAILIKLDSSGPIFYKQTRVGQGGKLFKLIKFRSMVKDAEKNGPLRTTEHDKRITKIGKFLRKTRLDEMPQFINILKGEMSFVGPRAERTEFHQEIQSHVPFFQERYLIKPGLTGWAQINYGYTSSLKDDFERIQYDLYYVKNRNFLLDLEIILKTINIVLRGGGR